MNRFATWMKDHLRRAAIWTKDHPWRAGITSACSAAILGAVATAIVSGAQSYAWAIARIVGLSWHPFPALGWALVGPLSGLGVLWIRERLRRPSKTPDESHGDDPSRYIQDAFPELHGIVWRWAWKEGVADPEDGTDLAKRIVDLRPYCPKCGRRLTLHAAWVPNPGGGRGIAQTILKCPKPKCFANSLPGRTDHINSEVCPLIEHKLITGTWKDAIKKPERGVTGDAPPSKAS